MLSNPPSAKVILVLALAILMAWAGHTSALLMGGSQSGWSAEDAAHGHAHSDGAFVCVVCSDHHHSSLTPDHVHETPHLTTLLGVNTQPERARPIEAGRSSIAAGPIFLIERPPRPLFVL